MDDSKIRLNKYLALKLGISRREADNLIAAGSVLVNGEKTPLGARVLGDEDIKVRGKSLDKSNPELIYVALHKPVGYLCSRRSQGGDKTVYDLLPESLKQLKTVGRLDRDSSGLILMTNDGDFAYKMTHPKFIKTKIYEIHTDKDLEPLHQQMIGDFGVDLEDGKSRLTLMKMNDNSRRDWQVTMHEGRNRQIRRTFLALGYKVLRLHRTTFGNYSLDDIKPGEFEKVNIR